MLIMEEPGIRLFLTQRRRKKKMAKFNLVIKVGVLKDIVKYLSKSVGKEEVHISSHFKFKKLAGQETLEASSFNGNFFCCVYIANLSLDPGIEFGFTVEAKRFSDAVSLLKDSDEVTLILDDVTSYSPKVTLKTGNGRIKFQSMNYRDNAPSWNEFKDDTHPVKLEIESVKSAFGFCSNFCRNMPQNPSISIIECANGIVTATDGATIAQVKSDMFKGISLKTHINNYAILKNALSFADSEATLHVSESRGNTTLYRFYNSEKSSLRTFLFGETKVIYSVPEVSTKWDDVCDGYLMFSKQNALVALNFINCGSSSKTSANQFVYLKTRDNHLVFEMASSVDEERAVSEIELVQNEDVEKDAIELVNLENCFFSFSDLVNVLKTMKTENVLIYVYLSEKNAVFCFRDESTDLRYQVSVGGFVEPVPNN